MVTKRLRSEYMKKFKDPKWETFSKCYEETVRYRLTRRLLEQSHVPWIWSGTDTDSDSSGTSPGNNQNQSQVQADAGAVGPMAELEECAGARTDREQPTPRIPEEEKEEDTGQGCQRDGATEVKVQEEVKEEQRSSKQPAAETQSGATSIRQVKASKCFKPTSQRSRVRPSTPQVAGEDDAGRRHPFVMYGSGERDSDTSGKKTHNVAPLASTSEIHQSALRAKTRREVERQMQNQRAERRRTKSADMNKKRVKIAPAFNPWVTEYMRSFSARAR